VVRQLALNTRLSGALVFLASGSVLVLEVVGLRLVGPYVGVTLQTSSAVIGVALAAIAYGAWTGGWLADRRDPRSLLAPLLLLAGVATALTLPLVRAAGAWLHGTDPTNVLLLAMLALFPPAALLSAITPLVIKMCLGDLRETGRVVGRLSGIGTLGGITATLGTGFVLVAAVPTSVIVLGLGGLLTVCSLLLYWYDRSRRFLFSGLAAVVLSGLLVGVAPDPCDVETAYHCARVTVDPRHPSGRILWLNGAQHSYVDLADPAHLEFAYARWIGAYLDALPPGPLDALHIGGGGFTLPGYLAATRPGSHSLVLELDADLVGLDRRRLGLHTGPDLTVRTGDARVNLRAVPDASRDVVFGDAFGHLVVPWHLTTREFVEDVRRTLRPDGLYALNVIDGRARRFVRAEVATVQAVFPYAAVVSSPAALRGDVPANFVILGSNAPLASFAPPGAQVLTGSGLDTFAKRASVLTDDFAPVDQLLGSST
jgi:MFS family permease